MQTVDFARRGQLTDCSQSQAEFRLNRHPVYCPESDWSIRGGSKGGYVRTMPNKSKKDKVSLRKYREVGKVMNVVRIICR